MKRFEVIQSALNMLGKDTYLEIGVLYGTVFTSINAKRKIAVDPGFKISLKRRLAHFTNYFHSKYFEVTSDVFFKKYADKVFSENLIDVAFIDGLHTYEQSLRDVDNTLRYLNPNGMIIMHDCNPTSPDMEKPSKSGDVWKTIVHLRTRQDINVFVIDEDCGLGIIVPKKSQPKLAFSKEEIKNMVYRDLDVDRENLLGLETIGFFKSFLRNYALK